MFSSLFAPKLRTPDQCVAFVLKNFFQLQGHDWRRIEGAVQKVRGASSESGLLYALRIASVVPSITSLETLGSRSLCCRGGAVGVGLIMAAPTSRKREVETFLDWLFCSRLEVIFAAEWEKQMARWAAAKTLSSQAKIVDKLDDFLSSANGLVDMPGVPPAVKKWRDALAAATQLRC